jgi:two-component system chemotaxis response regulator CheY
MVTVVVPDDSTYMRDLLKMILFESGHEVVGEASNGVEAVTQYKNLRPDVLLLDIVMSDGDIGKTGLMHSGK